MLLVIVIYFGSDSGGCWVNIGGLDKPGYSPVTLEVYTERVKLASMIPPPINMVVLLLLLGC